MADLGGIQHMRSAHNADGHSKFPENRSSANHILRKDLGGFLQVTYTFFLPIWMKFGTWGLYIMLTNIFDSGEFGSPYFSYGHTGNYIYPCSSVKTV